MSIATRPAGSRAVVAVLGAVLVVVVGAAVTLAAQARRDFDVVARKYSFSVSGANSAEIRVAQNDLVHINFSSEDIPHSFTIEDKGDSHYRIMRRAEPGKPVSIVFRADTAGSFRFFCSLTIDAKCKDMHGTLVVEAK